MTHRFESAETLEAWGRRVGARLTPADCLYLDGPLGAGKTTLVRALAGGYGVDVADVASPTYALHHVYTGEGDRVVHHLDGYRVEDASEFDQIGLDFLDPGLTFVEWPERFALLPPTARVRFALDGDDRLLTIEAAPGHPLHDDA